MARTEGQWLKTIGGYIKTASATGLNILINGTDRYLNFNLVSGSAGYGIRDNAGVMEFKDDSGSWAAFSTGGGGGINTEQAVDAVAAALALGTNTGITVTYDDAGNSISIAVADELFTAAMKTKVDHITVTQAVNLDDMETAIAALVNGMVYKGDFDASAGSYPSGAQIGWFYYVSVAGTIDGMEMAIGDNIVATVDGASTSDSAEWSKHDNTAAVQSVAGLVGAITGSALKSAMAFVKGDVGLGNVDNTSDADKPVSSATQTALNLKAALASPTFTGTVVGITKAMVGLGSVDNTADTAKPVSTAQQTALDAKLDEAGGTMTGDINMGGNHLMDVHEVNIDALPDTDHTANGDVTETFDATGTIAIMSAVYLDSSSEWANTDASATATAEAMIGIAMEAGVVSTALKVATAGSYVRDDSWAWTVGGQIFLSETAGTLTQTAPSATDSVVRVVGYAVSADVIKLEPQQGIIHV